MIWQRKKYDIKSDMVGVDSEDLIENDLKKIVLSDYFRFVFFCFLLIVPVYAIIKSAFKQDWIMVIIDTLLIPVGFVHGLLMLFGFVN